MKKYFIKIIEEAIERKVKRIAYTTSSEIIHSQFAYIGIERLKKIIDQASNAEEKYISMSELYTRVLLSNKSK